MRLNLTFILTPSNIDEQNQLKLHDERLVSQYISSFYERIVSYDTM